METLPGPGNLADVKSDVLGGTLVCGVEKERRQALCDGLCVGHVCGGERNHVSRLPLLLQ